MKVYIKQNFRQGKEHFTINERCELTLDDWATQKSGNFYFNYQKSDGVEETCMMITEVSLRDFVGDRDLTRALRDAWFVSPYTKNSNDLKGLWKLVTLSYEIPGYPWKRFGKRTYVSCVPSDFEVEFKSRMASCPKYFWTRKEALDHLYK